MTLNDEKVEQPSWQRVYLAPSAAHGAPGESEALEVLAHLLGGGQTSLLYRTLVLEKNWRVAAGAYYFGDALDASRFCHLCPAGARRRAGRAGARPRRGAIAELKHDGVSAEDVARASTRLVAEAVYAQDNQASLARWFGAALAEWRDRR